MKKMVVLNLVVVLAVGFLATSCVVTPTPTPFAMQAVGNAITSSGIVYQMPIPVTKSFEAVGLVFATLVTEFDRDGMTVSSDEGIVTMLLREAHQIGAHDIFNLRVDENITETVVGFETIRVRTHEGMRTEERPIVTRTITKTGSALAIRYTGSGLVIDMNYHAINNPRVSE